MICPRTAAATVLACSAFARADITLLSQHRELSVGAVFQTTGGTNQVPTQDSSAPGYGPWSDSVGVNTDRSAAAASLTSDVSTVSMTASGAASGNGSPLAGSNVSARARCRYQIDFSVTGPTPIQFHAALPTSTPQPTFVNSATTQDTRVYLRNITTGQIIAHVISGWGVYGPYATIEPPADLTTTLQAGHYQIDALLDEAGFASYERGTSYHDSATFEVSLTVQSCYANCDGSTTQPLLNVNDFLCFMSRFAAGDSYANCDGSTTAPILNIGDFLCFQGRFASGCP